MTGRADPDPVSFEESERRNEENGLIEVLLAALVEIEAINDESARACRKRMGTRRENTLVVARAAIAKAKGGAL